MIARSEREALDHLRRLRGEMLVLRGSARPVSRLRRTCVLRTHVYTMIGELERAGVGARLREVAVLRLRTAFGYATGKVVRTNPMIDVPRPRVPRRSMSVWTQAEARAFLAATPAT